MALAVAVQGLSSSDVGFCAAAQQSQFGYSIRVIVQSITTTFMPHLYSRAVVVTLTSVRTAFEFAR
jgi:hypothetical protein